MIKRIFTGLALIGSIQAIDVRQRSTTALVKSDTVKNKRVLLKSSLKSKKKSSKGSGTDTDSDNESDGDGDSDNESDSDSDSDNNSSATAPVGLLNDAPPPPPVAPAPPPPPPPPPAPKEEEEEEEEKTFAWTAKEKQLEKVRALTNKMQAQVVAFNEKSAWDSKIEADKTALAAATTEELANMLADIRSEMHELSVPVFTDVLDENVAVLQDRQETLVKEINAMKAEAKKNAEEKDKKEDDKSNDKKGDKKGGDDKKESDNSFKLAGAFVVGVLCVIAVGLYLSR